MRGIVKMWSVTTVWMLISLIAVGSVFAGGAQEVQSAEDRDTLTIESAPSRSLWTR